MYILHFRYLGNTECRYATVKVIADGPTDTHTKTPRTQPHYNSFATTREPDTGYFWPSIDINEDMWACIVGYVYYVSIVKYRDLYLELGDHVNWEIMSFV